MLNKCYVHATEVKKKINRVSKQIQYILPSETHMILEHNYLTTASKVVKRLVDLQCVISSFLRYMDIAVFCPKPIL